MNEPIAMVEKMPPNVQEILRLHTRVAELEAENAQHLDEIGRLHADILKLRGWEATPDGMREGSAGGAPVAAHAHSDVLAVEPPSSRRGEPAPDEDEIDRLLRGIRGALDYLNEGRDGDASFNLEALLAGSDYKWRTIAREP